MIVKHALVARTFVRKNVSPFYFYVLARLYEWEQNTLTDTSKPTFGNMAYELGLQKTQVQWFMREMENRGLVIKGHDGARLPSLTEAGMELFLFTLADMEMAGLTLTERNAQKRYSKSFMDKQTAAIRKAVKSGYIAPGRLRKNLMTGRWNLPI